MGVNIRDICYPFHIRPVFAELAVEQIFISMDLLSKILPLAPPLNFRQKAILLHDSLYCLWIAMDALLFKLNMHLSIGLETTLLAEFNFLNQFGAFFRVVDPLDVVAIAAP